MINTRKVPKKEDIPFILGIHRALNLTYIRYKKLTQYFDSWEEIFNASILHLQDSKIDTKGIERFVSRRSTVNLEQEVEKIQQCDAQILLHGTDIYPISLQEIYDPPAILFCRGALNASDFPSIAVVGSRRVSPYGKRCTKDIVESLARESISIVSGLAYGVDFLAHRAAVESGGRTIGVLGSGVDMITPTAHAHLAEQWIADERLVVLSEFPPGTQARAEHFPQRNRIITGLAKATVVIEAAMKSGSLISANLALEQDREVFAVPGSIYAPNSEGCNHLITQNIAAPAISGGQILRNLGLERQEKHQQAKQTLPKTGIESEIFSLLQDNQPYHIDDLSRTSKLSHQQLTSTLILMEMKGLVKNLGLQTYVRNI